MTTTELEVAIRFLKDLEARLDAESGGDFELPDTEKTRELVEHAEAANSGMTVEEWRASGEFFPMVIENGKIVTNDVLMLGFIRSQMEAELEEHL